MTIDEFFGDSCRTGECRHVVIPGGVDRMRDHLWFARNPLNADEITMGRLANKFDTNCDITPEDFQAFLDFKLGITDLWRRGVNVYFEDYSKKDEEITYEYETGRDIPQEILEIIIKPEEIKDQITKIARYDDE